MIVVMKAGAGRKEIQHVVGLVRELGLKEQVIRGRDRTIVACIGDNRTSDKSGAGERADGRQDRAGAFALQARRDQRKSGAHANPDRAGAVRPGRAASGRDRRTLRGRKPRPDSSDRRGGAEGGRDRSAGRGVQAADQPLCVPGAGPQGPRDARRGPRADGTGDCDGGHRRRADRRGGAITATCCRSARGTCNITRCFRRAAGRANP